MIAKPDNSIGIIQQNIKLLDSFHQFETFTALLNVRMYFDNNSAVDAGIDLYGGSVDSCTLNSLYLQGRMMILELLFNVITESKSAVSSDSLRICSCKDVLTGSYHPEPVYPGAIVEVPVIALGQRNGRTRAVIRTINTTITTSQLELF